MIERSLKSPVFLFLLILLIYLVGLWSVSIPLTGDQKVYLSIALEMAEKKQWLIPSLFGEPNFLKPPFQYWASMLGWQVFGLSIFGALLPSVLALLGGAFFTFEIGKKLELTSPSIGALLYVGTFGSMTYGSTAQMEIWIVFFMLAAWWAILCSRLLLAYVLVGVMAWVKGPLYPALWTICYTCWNWRGLQTKKFWASLLVGTAIGLTWYGVAATTHREEMIKQFFYTENLGKMGTHQGSVVGLWSEFVFSLFPWFGLFILGCFQHEARDRWRKNRHFYLAYSLVPILFFTVFPYRVNSYFYFLTPVFAMMASEIQLPLSPRLKAIGSGFYFVFFAVLGALLFRLIQGEWVAWPLAILAVVSLGGFIFGFWRGRWSYLAVSSLLIVNMIRLIGVQIGEKDIADLRSFLASRSTPLAYYVESRDIWHEFGLISAAIATPVQMIFEKNNLDTFLARGGAVIFQEDQQSDFQKSLQCKDWKRLKRRTKFPVQQFLREGIHWGDPEMMRDYHICTLGQ